MKYVSSRRSKSRMLVLGGIHISALACSSQGFVPLPHSKPRSCSPFRHTHASLSTLQYPQAHAASTAPHEHDDQSHDLPTKPSPSFLRRAIQASSAALLSCLLTCALSVPTTSLAADYGSLTAEQKTVAEAWRLVDNSFLDRTFNKQDWFQMRQDLIKKKYKSMDEAQTAIDTMMNKLGDKYTRYLPPAKYQSIVDTATGTLANSGVGIEISTNKQGSIIASDVEANAPASNGGILPGDVFVEVDGTRFDDGKSTPDDVAVKLRGPKGSKVGVVMKRNDKTLDYILTREPIKITSVRSYLSSVGGVGKVGVIRIKSFSGTTADLVKGAYEELKKKGAQAFVIDVRGNPGGLLPGGVDTASLFLNANKPLVFVVDKKGVVDSQETLSDGIDVESPLVVLVDSSTASAAEVFAAALKENDRATIAGEQTFGKGIIQTIRELSNDNGGVAITVARYETPKHNDINKQGVRVDVSTSVECPKTDATACISSSAFRKSNI